MLSTRLSVRYGHGDLHWFDGLTHEDQVLLLAYEAHEASLRPPPPKAPPTRRG
jgi:hypothetical protein